MKIEIVAIGNEVLSGHAVNTNAAFLSGQLLQEGWRVSRHVVLPDDEAILRTGLKESLSRSDLVICTGGLGPTCDDITRQVVAELVQSDFRFDETIYQDLKKRYGDFPSLQDQATVPSKAFILKNSNGTAPGFIFKTEECILILLPGVPPEMKAMWQNEALPYLRKHLPATERSFKKQLNIFNVSESAIDPMLRKLQKECPHVEFGIYPGQRVLGVHLTTLCKDAEAAEHILEKPYQALVEQFGENTFESITGKIEEAVHNRFIESNLRLAIAESCTGGSICRHLTLFPGTSNYLLGSFVVYTNEMKTEILGVPKNILNTCGAVSAESIQALLDGLFEKTACDYGIAVSGIAGPGGGTTEKPVGTIWCGVKKRGTEAHIWQFHARGNREMVIERAVHTVFAGLLKYMAAHHD